MNDVMWTITRLIASGIHVPHSTLAYVLALAAGPDERLEVIMALGKQLARDAEVLRIE